MKIPDSITFSALKLERLFDEDERPVIYKGSYFDPSGKEYAHVTRKWISERLFELTGLKKWNVEIINHGNGHYSVEAKAIYEN